MIERLNQISVSDFIEISCGNYECLLLDNESYTEDELKKLVSKLIIDYRNIVNPTEMKALIIDKEEFVKEQSKILILRICQTLISINCFEDVRELIALLGVDTNKMDIEQLISKVNYMFHSAIFEKKRNDERRHEAHEGNKATPEQIRSSFDAEIAFLMTFFKMNIDIHNTNAAVYANIIHQAELEIAYKKRRS